MDICAQAAPRPETRACTALSVHFIMQSWSGHSSCCLLLYNHPVNPILLNYIIHQLCRMMSSDIKVRKLHLLSHCVCWVCFTLFTLMKNGFWKAEIKQTTKALTLAVVSVGNNIYKSRYYHYYLHRDTMFFSRFCVHTLPTKLEALQCCSCLQGKNAVLHDVGA